MSIAWLVVLPVNAFTIQLIIDIVVFPVCDIIMSCDYASSYVAYACMVAVGVQWLSSHGAPTRSPVCTCLACWG